MRSPGHEYADFFRHVFDEAPIQILITEPNLEPPGPRIVYVNKELCLQTGFAREELIGKTPRIFQGPETPKEMLNELKEGLRSQGRWQGSGVNYLKSGARVLVDWSISAIRGERGEVLYYFSLRQEALRLNGVDAPMLESQAIRDAAEHLAKVGIFSWVPGSPNVSWSTGLQRILGLGEGSSPRFSAILDRLPEPGRQLLEESFGITARDGDPFLVGVPFETPSGRRGHARVMGLAGSSADQPIVLGLIQDDSEAQYQKELFGSVLDLSSCPFLVVSPEKRIQRINLAWSRLLGRNPDSLVGRPWRRALPATAPDRLEDSFDPEAPGPFEASIAFPDGNGGEQTFRWRSRFHPISRATVIVLKPEVRPEPIGSSRELATALEKAEAEGQSKSLFLTMMSHELRTPLNHIIGYTELLLLQGKDEDSKQMLETILRSGEHLVALVEDILDVSRLESGKFELRADHFSLRELLESCVADFRLRFTEAGLTLELAEFRASEAASGEMQVSDVRRIRQVLYNLLSNALKFTRKGGVFLELFLVRDDGNRFDWELMIRDTGIGIPAEELERVFEVFSQVDESSTREFGGCGLGLAISKAIAEALGGSLFVESEVGVGSTFCFLFPTYRLPPGDDDGTTLENGKGEANRFQRADPVLVVEDEPAGADLIQRVLRPMGVRTVVAVDGEQAEAYLAAERFSLILTDLQLPRLDGETVVARTRQGSGPNVATPILVASAHVGDDVRARCARIGVSGFLTKPLSVDKLRETVEYWLTHSAVGCGRNA